jgi:hypothetical protein
VNINMSSSRFTSKLRPIFALAAFAFLASDGLAQGTAYCFGDGSGANCPCSNLGFPGGGCSNSSFPGAIFSAQGTASIANDALTLRCVLVPFDASGTAVLFQGATAISSGSAFGAGLLCIGGSVRRLGVKSLAAGAVEFGAPVGDPALSVTGGIAASGTVMNYQVWYRDTLAGCPQPPFNLSNGMRVTWGA